MGLPAGEVMIQLSGFRVSELDRSGVRLDVFLPEAALRQLVETGMTGAVAGENLRVELVDVEIGDGAGTGAHPVLLPAPAGTEPCPRASPAVSACPRARSSQATRLPSSLKRQWGRRPSAS